MASCADYLGLWPADQQAIAYGVCLAESRDRLDAECLDCVPGVKEDSVCWWQINLDAHPQYDRQRLKTDPVYCAQAAHDVWEAAGWDAWSTYRNGAYLAFVDGAPAAVVAAPSDVVAPAAVVQTSAQPNVSPWVLLGAAALALWAAGEL